MPFGLWDYNKAGKGVAKNEPEKKPFFKFFELFSRKFWQLFQINMLYMLFCIPIVTIGPATAAMTQIMRKYVLEQPIFMFSEFWNAFKKNFKQALIIGIFDVLFIILFAYSFIFYNSALALESTTQNTILMAVTTASAIMVSILHFYIYPQIVALNLKLPAIIKNSLLLTILGLKSNVVTLVVSAFLVITMVLLFPYSVFALPFLPAAWISFLGVFNSYPVIQKHIITPYYEARGEKNPEIPFVHEEDKKEALFEDFGGREQEIKSKPKTKGKVIK